MASEFLEWKCMVVITFPDTETARRGLVGFLLGRFSGRSLEERRTHRPRGCALARTRGYEYIVHRPRKGVHPMQVELQIAAAREVLVKPVPACNDRCKDSPRRDLLGRSWLSEYRRSSLEP